jgi:hypothetical protein
VSAQRVPACTALACTLLALAGEAGFAQTRPQPGPARPQPAQPARRAPAPPADSGLRVRGFGDLGLRWFAAPDTFDAVLGSKSGTLFGGGAEVVWGRHLSVSFDISRFQATGERVFVSNGEVFRLGLDTDVRITPLAVTVAYRFPRPRSALTPFVGGGVNWHRYDETSAFAAAGEDVSSTFAGFHATGGAEWRLARLVAVAGVGRWVSVPGAIGQEPTSAARAFGEENLGGFEAKVRVVVGR